MKTMSSLPRPLARRLAQVERLYRRRLRLAGWLRLGGALLLLVPLLSLSLPQWALWGVPLWIPCAAALLLGWYLWVRWVRRPSRRPLDVRRLALYIDERHPELEDLAISSVELGNRAEVGGASSSSAWMAAAVLRQAGAIEATEPAPPWRLRRLALGGLALWGGVLAVGGALLFYGDWQLLKSGFFVGGTAVGGFEVRPGDARVARGSDQLIWVSGGEAGHSAALRWRQEGGDWQTEALRPTGGVGVFFGELSALEADTEYQVQLGRQRSPRYRLQVWTPPAVEAVDMRLQYPPYMGIEERQIIDGGDISAPEGTRVIVEVGVNTPLAAAALVFESGDSLALERLARRRWGGDFVVGRTDAYRVSMADPAGEAALSVRSYAVTAQPDLPPEVKIYTPDGDDEATALEEIPLRFAVSDDFGLEAFGVQYEVVGRPSVRLDLSAAADTTGRVEHLLALEELDVAAGDLITWTVWATDGRPERLAYEALGDPFFIEIRPYERHFSAAVSNEGNQRAGPSASGPAADQKQVVIATWNLRRQAGALDSTVFGARLASIVEAQDQVRQGALQNGAPPGKEEAYAALMEQIAAALEALGQAAWPEPTAALSAATTHQQRAYRHLLQLAPRRVEVAQRQAGGGGGGGGGSARQREIDQLEATRRRDFREQASSLDAQMRQAEAVRGWLDELARRQAAINEDIAQLVFEAARQPQEGPDERRLERLRQEQRRNLAALDAVEGRLASGDLAADQARQARQRLAEVRRQMERSADQLAGGRAQEARAAGQRAVEGLERMDEALEGLSRQAAASGAERLRRQFDALREEQQEIAADMDRGARQGGSLGAVEENAAELMQRQAARRRAVEQFMEEAGRLATEGAGSQEAMARRLGDWLRLVGGGRLGEEMQQSQDFLRYGVWDEAAASEKRLAAALDTAAAGLDSVLALAVTDELQGMEKALQRLQEVVGQGRRLAAGEGEAEGEQGAAGGPGDYLEAWNETVRQAEELLPGGDGLRRQVGTARGRLEAARQAGRRGTAPRFELVFDEAIAPLARAADELAEQIARRRRGEEGLPQTGAVPPRYRRRVAEYFEALSEWSSEWSSEAGGR